MAIEGSRYNNGGGDAQSLYGLTTDSSGNIVPYITNTKDLGSSSYKFKDGYFAGDLAVGDDLTVTGDITVSGNVIRTSQTRICKLGAKVGATSGWVVAAAANVPAITCPASQTGSTLVIPVNGLKVGDTITGFTLVGQIESAGGAVTLDCDLRKRTVAAADWTDASVGSMTQVSVTADTSVSQAKTGLSDTVALGEEFYFLITATTAGSTDIDLGYVAITVTES